MPNLDIITWSDDLGNISDVKFMFNIHDIVSQCYYGAIFRVPKNKNFRINSV